MPTNGRLNDSELTEITEAIELLTVMPQLSRLDIKLVGADASALIYWAGNVLRVDIKGLR